MITIYKKIQLINYTVGSIYDNYTIGSIRIDREQKKGLEWDVSSVQMMS